jgi:hypothetical protein
MNYQTSIQAVNAAQEHYFTVSDQHSTDADLSEAFETLQRLKAEHKATFGELVRVDGEWI